ncbi:MAG TPA: tetratricopeptide repeat protein [Bryobacteraceae bacterium]|nr:tetratricopeptide repeat protein [Bryobacteraceae bacterium]
MWLGRQGQGVPFPMVTVSVSVIVMFTLTGFLARYYRSQRLSRAHAYYDAGVKLAAGGHNEDAIDQYRKALIFSPDSFDVRLSLAVALLNGGRLAEAETHFLDLQQSDPASGEINLELARVAVKTGRDSDAVASYHRAIYGYWPNHSSERRLEARWELIGLLEKHKQNQQAIAELLELFNDAPDDPALKNRIGKQFLKFKSYSNAAQVFEDNLSRHRHDRDSTVGEAEAQFAVGHYVDAQRAYRQAFRLEPGNSALLQRLAIVNLVVNLDPSLSRLTSAQREARVSELLERVLHAMRDCAELQPGAAPAFQADEDRVQQLLTIRRRRKGEEVVPEMMGAAQQLWLDRARICGAPRPSEEPLAILLGGNIE